MVGRAAQRVGTYFYFLPTYAQAKKVVWQNIDNDGFKMLDHIPRELIKSKNETDLKIELVNGSVIQLMGADVFGISGVGTNPIGVVFSEYSLCSPKAWQYVAPILAANKGWAIFNFTPRGRNHAWELLKMAEMNPLWFTEVVTVDDTNVISQADLDEEKAHNPEAFYRQEYYCEFTENAGQFFRRIKENLYEAEDFPIEGNSYQVGVDLAKMNDYTVITPFDLNTFHIHKQDRFNQVDWPLQKARIEAAAGKYNHARVKIDGTGIGNPIVDDLRAAGLNIGEDDAVKFTEQSRANLLNNLAIMLEQDKIRIPNEEGLIAELESFQYVLGPSGKTKVMCPESMHDDRVMSLALAVYQVPNQLGIEPRTQRFKERGFGLYSATYT
jgi:hypothetical protein